jgi:hypothetical protein
VTGDAIYLQPGHRPGVIKGKQNEIETMKVLVAFLIWCLLFVLSWPVAILAVILFPFIWLLCLPLRLLGIAVGSVFAFLKALLFLPARLLERGSSG